MLLNQPLQPTTVSKAVSYELREKNNFANAEILFGYLIEILDEKKSSNVMYNEFDITAFQRAVSTLVRYAPSPNDSRYYFNLALAEFDKPLRTSTLELTILNNLVFVHSQHNDTMEDALNIIKTALEIGVFRFKVTEYYRHQPSRFNDPLSVFETLSKKVLKYHGLEFNQDKTDVQKHIKKN
ncbi:hypothetical protein HPULCUR_001662 [Helicostylum pulchrum]|uniref:Uncharacterized protein n=1 Tax=Helicostylum pulchrum TaxID=562976 RepID=A0ABP9XNC1_9FUNG